MAPKTDHRRSEIKAQAEKLGSSREQLLDAATRVFARRGYRDASMNEIAAEAGFSKGALYWNFESKGDLFFALLDERVDTPLRSLFEASGSAPAGQEFSPFFSALLEENHELALLFHEYSAIALRDPKLRARFVERNRMLRARIAAGIEARNEELGVSPVVPAEQIATAAMGLAHGLSIDQLTDPDSASPNLLGEIFDLIETGNSGTAKEEA